MVSRLHKNVICWTVGLFWAVATQAGEYQAVSLHETQGQLASNKAGQEVARTLGRITRPMICVYDETSHDLIIVGECEQHGRVLQLDDLVVAMRAVMRYKESPLVSIDPAPSEAASEDQPVRFAGNVEDTQFGQDLLAADVLLKRLGLGKVSAEVWGVRSYFDLSAADWKRTGNENRVLSRFWFRVDEQASAVAARKAVGLLKRLRIKVETEVSATTQNLAERGGEALRDTLGDAFASSLTANLDDLMLSFPELQRLDQLYRLVGIASAIDKWQVQFGLHVDGLDFWLTQYPLREAKTPRTYKLVSSTIGREVGAREVTMTISGGVELSALVADVRSGSLSAIRELVLESRPQRDAVVWSVPFGDSLKSLIEGTATVITPIESVQSDGGMHLRKDFSPGVMSSPIRWTPPHVSPLGRPGTFSVSPELRPPARVPRVGGVMLENVASVQGEQGSPLDMAQARFSFVVGGENARLDPQTFRKFVTALWAVYYSNEDPGISIDPIAPGAKKHLVRYIGQVINTDLGRVMREADYLMKKWSVGTEDPQIAGFKSPLDYAADQGMLSVGAWSRFWFVPKDMQFRRADNLLLFESGRMTVQTEYMFQGVGAGADPANLKFAEFFTDHYQEIAKKYPVYAELYEYAEMVSLAKYLKESGVPLFWFLMANKDLVITEDSVGTVDALFKDSRRFEGVSVEGGVELRSEGQYIYDNEAVNAINAAIRNAPAPTVGTTSIVGTPGSIRAVSDPFTFALKNRSFSVLPQHTSSSSKDYRGLRYQTDFALKEAGYQLTDESWRDLRQAIFRITFVKLLYEASENSPSEDISLIQTESWRKAEALSDDITDNLRQILNQDFESEARFHHAVEKCLPLALAEEWKALITKYAFYNTTLELVRCYHPYSRSEGLFGAGWDLLVPYRLKASGEEKVELGNAVLPKRMAIGDRLSGREEVLTFSDSRFQAAAYVPDDVKSSQVVGLFIMADGSFRLLDKIENEFEFDAAGYLTKMIFSEVHQIAIEYQKDFAARLDTPPYKIERASTKWVQFRSVNLPERLRVKSLTDESSEEFIFTEDKAVVGYAPADPKTSHFEFLALMSDLSYRLVAKNEDEMAFNQSGTFEKLISTSEQCLVKSMSSGNYTVEFGYTLNKVGKPVIAEASLVKAGASEPQVTMQYSYDSEGRLSAATTVDPGAEVTRRDQTDDQIESISRGILAKQM